MRPAKEVHQLLNLKGKTNDIKLIMQYKFTPCVITVYFHFLGCNSKEYVLWLEPEWSWGDLLEKIKKITEHREQYILSSGLVDIKTLLEEQ